jgi:hypothetical protein
MLIRAVVAPAKSPHVARCFLHQIHVAEFAHRRRAGIFRGFAAMRALLRRHAQMALNLLVQIAFPSF